MEDIARRQLLQTILGGPVWLDSDRYEIVAKAEQPVDDDGVLMAMLQTLDGESPASRRLVFRIRRPRVISRR